MKTKLITGSLALMTALLIVWGALMSFDWVEEYVATKQSPTYEALPFEFKLKAKPEDVIFSEAYTTADGKDIVKYAYVADEVGPQLNEDIQRRTSNSYTEVINQFKDEEGKPMETLKTTFLPKPQFYQKDGQWRQVEYATTTPEIFAMSGAIPHIKKRELAERLLPGKSVFGATSTFYPDANTETSSVDGWSSCQRGQPDDPCMSYSDASSGSCTTNSANDSGTTVSVGDSLIEIIPGVSWQTTIWRGFFLFDTSSLGTSATISSATLSLYVTTHSYGDIDYINIFSSTPSSNTAIASADYSNVGSTEFSTGILVNGSLATYAYSAFTLNSDGRNNISKTGISKFSARLLREAASACTGFYDQTTRVDYSSADQTGTSQDPKLEVVYTVPSKFSFGQWFPF